MLSGVMPVIPTPFSQDGQEILYDHFERLVDHCINEGANALVLFGAGSEFYKLSDAECEALLRHAVTACGGRLPIVATVTKHATLHAQHQAELYQRLGADAINVMPPSFAAPSGAMIAHHMIELAKVVRVPFILQYAPALTGGHLNAEVFAQIADGIHSELYIKVEVTPTGPAITSLLQATGGRYRVIIGNGGECMYEALMRGAVGVMCGAALLRPYCRIYDAHTKGEQETAYRYYTDFLPYLHFIHRHIEEFVCMEKMILVERGIFPNHACRGPNMLPDEASRKLLMQIYRTLAH